MSQAPNILLADKKGPALTRLAKALKAEGLEIRTATDRNQAEQALAQGVPDVLVYAQKLPGEQGFELCRALKGRDATAACMVVAARADKKLRQKAEAAGVDQLLVKPLAPKDLAVSARAMAQVRRLRQQLAQPEAAGSAEPDPLYDRVTGFYTFERFKEVLFVEVKRARRYGFPVALLLATIEPEGGGEVTDPALRDTLQGGLAVAVRGAIRDTDLPVAYGNGNVLLLMPHTDKKGASTVAKRILFRVAKGVIKHGQTEVKPRVSIGFSASAASQLVFSEMVREATTSLGQARERGGNCVVPSEAA